MSNKYNQFITANTIEMDLAEIEQEHLIPVHIKDNEPCIAHHQFIDGVLDGAKGLFGSSSEPLVRVSHPIKGRIASAKHKPAKELLPDETTLYYERMAWVASFPEHTFKVGDDVLELSIGGVKSYSLDNLYSTKDNLEQFKVFVGFKNQVCTNLCISTDGYMSSIRANTTEMLVQSARQLFQAFSLERSLSTYKQMNKLVLSETEFAHLLGRGKMFNAMPRNLKSGIPNLGVTDSQLSVVAEDYYKDKSHARTDDGSIDLWRVYNLFTGANKSSYIDTILDRNVSIFEGIQSLSEAIANKTNSWYLN